MSGRDGYTLLEEFMASVLNCVTLTYAVMTKSGSDVDIVNDV